AESGRRQREDEREVGSAHPEQRLERLQENTERVERAERKVEHGGGHDGAPGARPDRGVVHDAPGNYGNRAATRMRARGAASGVTTALRRSPRTESYFQWSCPDGARTGSPYTSSTSSTTLTIQYSAFSARAYRLPLRSRSIASDVSATSTIRAGRDGWASR